LGTCGLDGREKRQATSTKDSWKPCKDNSLAREGNKWQRKATLVLSNQSAAIRTTVLYCHTKVKLELGTCGLGGWKKGRQHGPKTAGNLARITHLQGKEQVAEESNPCPQQPKHSYKNYCLILPHKKLN